MKGGERMLERLGNVLGWVGNITAALSVLVAL